MTTSTLHLATPLRRFSRGAATLPVRGSTLAAAIDDAELTCPGLRAAIIQDGRFAPFVTALIDDGSFRDPTDLETSIPDGCRIRLVCAVAGG